MAHRRTSLLTWTLALMLPLQVLSQQTAWDSWDAAVVRELNTAAGLEYLNEEETKVILFMNMARHDGTLFAETFLKTYIRENNTGNNRDVRSLSRDLKQVAGHPPLIPEEDLTFIAREHATRSGNTGHVGHGDFNRRFKPLMGNPYLQVGENCSYGYERAIDIVITLLIDEGVKGQGHRRNILNESFNSVGVAIRPHKRYRVNCVMDFGRRIRSELNEVPY
jgi:uncharacterized protein YkwD